MKRSLPSCFAIFLLGFAAPSALAQTAAPKLEFGDGTSATLTSKAWQALEAKDYAAVDGYAGRCIEEFKDKAVEMQKSLGAPPDTNDKEKTPPPTGL